MRILGKKNGTKDTVSKDRPSQIGLATRMHDVLHAFQLIHNGVHAKKKLNCPKKKSAAIVAGQSEHRFYKWKVVFNFFFG